MPATCLGLGFGILLLLAEARAHRRLAGALAPRPSPPPLPRYPSVTVIRPVKGLDPGATENLRAGLDTGYPGPVQTIFVFDDEGEPALALARAAIEEHERSGRPGSAEIVFSGAPPAGRTGKLNAMIQGLAKARGEIIAFADSDIRTDRHALRVLVETLDQSPGAGSAFAPVVVSEPARTLGDAVCAILLNGLYTPPSAAAARRQDGELPFILGQFMVMSREALAAIGGLESVQGQLVDDLYIGQLVRAAGLRNLVSTHPIRIVQYGLRARDAVQVASRWFTFSRTGIPDWRFKLPLALRASAFWTGLAATLAFGATGEWLTAGVYAALAALETASVNALHHRVGGAQLRGFHRLAPALIYLLAPLLLARAHWLRHVRWRGRDYALDEEGRLAARTAAERGGSADVEGQLSLHRFRGHRGSHGSAVGVCDVEMEASIVHEGVRAGGGRARPQERQEHRGHCEGVRSHGGGGPGLDAVGRGGFWAGICRDADDGGARGAGTSAAVRRDPGDGA